MADTESQLFEKFKQWAHGPDTALRSPPTHGLQDALEAGLWAAYRAGYAQALDDSEAALGAFASAGGARRGKQDKAA